MSPRHQNLRCQCRQQMGRVEVFDHLRRNHGIKSTFCLAQACAIGLHTQLQNASGWGNAAGQLSTLRVRLESDDLRKVTCHLCAKGTAASPNVQDTLWLQAG